jgi:hypothetical protein
MAQDKKYGQVTLEHGHIPDDEPVMVFRGRDLLLPKLIGLYWNLCQQAGSPQAHLDLVSTRHDEIDAWQDEHPDQVQVPASKGYTEAHQDGP